MRKLVRKLVRYRNYVIAVLATVVIASSLTSALAYRAAEVVSESRTLYSVLQVTSMDYRVGVRPSIIYDNASWVGPGDPLYTRLVEYVNITYEHRSEALIGELLSENGTYSVSMSVSSGRGWVKETVLVPPTPYSGGYSGIVTLSMGSLLNLIDRLQQETGLSSSTYTITVEVSTDSSIRISGVGERANKYVTSAVMELRLGEGRMSIETEGERSGVSEDVTNTQQNTVAVLGREVPVAELRRYSTTALTISMACLIAVTAYPRRRVREPDRKYRDVIVDGKAVWTSTLPVVEVARLTDLVKLAKDSGKPVIRSVKEDEGLTVKTYTLLDGGVVYVHRRTQPRQN